MIPASFEHRPGVHGAVSEVPGGLVPPPVREHVHALARDERRFHEDVAAMVR